MANKNIRSLSSRKELDDNLFENIATSSQKENSKEELQDLAKRFMIDDSVVFGAASFYDFCRRTGIAPVPGRRGWYDPKLVRARLDAVQGMTGAMRDAVSNPSLVAQRRARRAQE